MKAEEARKITEEAAKKEVCMDGIWSMIRIASSNGRRHIQIRRPDNPQVLTILRENGYSLQNHFSFSGDFVRIDW